MENKLVINVYDDNDNIIKTSEAQVVDFRFGTIRRLMEVLKVDDINDTAELLKTLYKAWNQITNILEKAFPDMHDDDWDNVKLSELLPVLMVIMKSSFIQMMAIPTDSKNLTAE